MKRMKLVIVAAGLLFGVSVGLALHADIKFFWLDKPTGRTNQNDPKNPNYANYKTTPTPAAPANTPTITPTFTLTPYAGTPTNTFTISPTLTFSPSASPNYSPTPTSTPCALVIYNGLSGAGNANYSSLVSFTWGAPYVNVNPSATPTWVPSSSQVEDAAAAYTPGGAGMDVLLNWSGYYGETVCAWKASKDLSNETDFQFYVSCPSPDTYTTATSAIVFCLSTTTGALSSPITLPATTPGVWTLVTVPAANFTANGTTLTSVVGWVFENKSSSSAGQAELYFDNFTANPCPPTPTPTAPPIDCPLALSDCDALSDNLGTWSGINAIQSVNSNSTYISVTYGSSIEIQITATTGSSYVWEDQVSNFVLGPGSPTDWTPYDRLTFDIYVLDPVTATGSVYTNVVACVGVTYTVSELDPSNGVSSGSNAPSLSMGWNYNIPIALNWAAGPTAGVTDITELYLIMSVGTAAAPPGAGTYFIDNVLLHTDQACGAPLFRRPNIPRKLLLKKK